MKYTDQLIEIYRFDDAGFYCKPYTSSVFHHVFEFINTEIIDLNTYNQKIAETSLHRPTFNDSNWSGCFCFLGEYNKNITSKTGALSMRNGERLNLALIPKDTKLWVRNCSHLGKEVPFFKEFTYSYMHEGKEYYNYNESRFDCFRWVRMSASLALERTRLWKEKNKESTLPEWLTEFYLLESQLLLLSRPPLARRTKIYIKNLLQNR